MTITFSCGCTKLHSGCCFGCDNTGLCNNEVSTHGEICSDCEKHQD